MTTFHATMRDHFLRLLTADPESLRLKGSHSSDSTFQEDPPLQEHWISLDFTSHTSPSTRSCDEAVQNCEDGLAPIGIDDPQTDDAVDVGPRLREPAPFDDGFIAFGTVQLYDRSYSADGDKQTFIRGNPTDDVYPNFLIRQGLAKRWIRIDGLSIGTRSNVSTLRLYILPEDVDRSDRGSLKDFRKLIRYLLNYVDCSTEAWLGHNGLKNPIKIYQEPLLDEEQSLFYIFNTLKSPETSLDDCNADTYSFEAITSILKNDITGLNTPLYPYQQRSAMAMLKRESDPAKIRDVRKHKFLDIYGRTFFLDLKDGALCRHRPLYTEPQGGVLAETMGYGKTLICLALILATRGHYSKIPSRHVELTQTKTHSSIPSLLEIAARKLRHEGLPWKTDFYHLRKQGFYYDRCIAELEKHERVYNALQNHSTFLNPSRKGKPEYMVPIRLSSVTLVVVPPNLIIQWQQEIDRHVDADSIELLVLDKSDTSIPQWGDLVKYDIVLISKARFEQEYRDDDLNQGRIARGQAKYTSPLTQIRWLRVICDEGHGFAGSSSKTKAMAMLDKMAIERRWVVSGTPSNTLHGVEVGLTAVESHSPTEQSLSRSDSLHSALKNGRSPQSLKAEKTDFERLRLTIVNFLQLQPWANRRGDDKADFKDYLAPRIGHDGIRRSVPALKDVLQTLIVRHRIEDVDRDLTLPTLHNKVVHIKPSYYDKLTINLFIMILISNYITSEREDEDYMFHPKNHKKLSTLISNMSTATFHWMGITEKDVRSTIRISSKYLDEHIDTISDEDGLLLTEAIMSGERALANPGWRAFSAMHEIGAFIANFPENARDAWALDGLGTDPLLMGTTQAREVQRYVQNSMLSNDTDPLRGLVGAGLKTMNAARGKADEFQKQYEKSGATDNDHASEIGTKEEPKVRANFTRQSPIKPHIRKGSPKGQTQDGATEDIQDALDHIPNAQILGFSSSKLTYLTHRLLDAHPNEKTIIFYTNNNTAFFIAEALELLHVTFRIYANTLSVGKRAEYLAQFNAEDEFKVLLMDLKQAALGLHIAVASRVYIMSPIWDSSLESQAIKRAHRIGQTREVYVETLVLTGTFEEAMIRRRAERQAKDKTSAMADGTLGSTSSSQDLEEDQNAAVDKKDMLNDSGMVDVLKNIRFSKFEEGGDKIPRLGTSVPLFHKTTHRDDCTGDLNAQNAGQATEFSNHATIDTPPDKNEFSTIEASVHGSSTASEIDSGIVHDNSGLQIPLRTSRYEATLTRGEPRLFPTVHVSRDVDTENVRDQNTERTDSNGDARPVKKARFA